MPNPRDPRSVAVSYRAYWALLKVYPRRFRRQYRTQMAQVFLDCCREAYHAGGRRALPRVWGRALLDLTLNASGERIVESVKGGAMVTSTRSCSGCYSEVEPDWRTCKICGTVLSASTTHDTHPSLSTREAPLVALFQFNDSWTFHGPK